jgi:hypothetical protein
MVTPKGKILAETFDTDKSCAESKAYDLLFYRYRWPRAYWKQWTAFKKERERRGWYVFPVKLRLV